MVLNSNTGRKSRKFSRKGASAIAVGAIFFASTLAGTSAALGADGDPSFSVNKTQFNVSVTGTVSADCAAGTGSYDLTVVNNDVVDGQTVGHSVTVEVNANLNKSTGAIFDSTPTPLANSFALPFNGTVVEIKVQGGAEQVSVFQEALNCPVAPPDPSATIGAPNLTMTFEPGATSGYVSITGPVEFQNVPEGSTTAVSFTVEGPGSPSASNSSADGSYQSSFAVTLTDVEQTFTVTAHALLDGSELASSGSSVITLPAIDNGGGENPGGGGENPGGGGENPGNGGTPGGENPGGNPGTENPGTGTPNTGGSNPGTTPQQPGDNSEYLPKSVNAGGELSQVWGGVTPTSTVLGVAALVATGILVFIVLKRRESPTPESAKDVQ